MPKAKTTTEETVVKAKVTHNERCYNQFTTYCKEKGITKINEDAFKNFIVDCADGWPNDNPKKESSLNIKYRGIVNYLKSQGKKVELKRGFVTECLESRTEE